MKLPVGTKVKFAQEKQRYTVQASDDRFAVCTKPFNLQHTVLYTIVDFHQHVRGPENLIFGFGAETREECQKMLARLNDKDDPTGVSHRHRVALDIEPSQLTR
jgi:hypothetical protein